MIKNNTLCQAIDNAHREMVLQIDREIMNIINNPNTNNIPKGNFITGGDK